MLKYFIAVILLGHGLIVGAQTLSGFGGGSFQPANPAWLSWWPATLGRSWFLVTLNLEGSLIEKMLGLLWLASGVCLIAAALGVLGWVIPIALWQTLAIYGAAGSLVLLLLYLHPFFIIGVLLDVAILVALLWARWPPSRLVGA